MTEKEEIKFEFTDDRTREERIVDNEKYLQRFCKMAARYKGDDKFLGEVLAGLERCLLPFGIISIDLNDIESAMKDGDIYWDTVVGDDEDLGIQVYNTINQRIASLPDQSLYGIILRFWLKDDNMELLKSVIDKVADLPVEEFKYNIACNEDYPDEVKLDIFYNFV